MELGQFREDAGGVAALSIRAKKLIPSPTNEPLPADISNEVASVFRFDGARHPSENLAIPNPPWAD
jgi:hypothetical protein